MKDKIIKLSIAIGILLVGISLFYYFVILANQKEQRISQEKLFNLQQECRDLGEKYYQYQSGIIGSGATLLSPEYHYNQKLKTCLYSDGYSSSGYFSRQVIDLISNETLLFYGSEDFDNDGEWNDVAGSITSEEFNRQKEILFNE